jgi:predicted RNase H-like nuclease (RuvC/YqgF family)
MADTERLDKETEVNPSVERREHGMVFVSQAVLRKMVCDSMRWPAALICLFVAAVGIATIIQSRALPDQIEALRAEIAAQETVVAATDVRVEYLDDFRGTEIAAVKNRVRELSANFGLLGQNIDKLSTTTAKFDGRMAELNDRMDRAAAQVSREADARRDLIRTMEAMGQRMQRQ